MYGIGFPALIFICLCKAAFLILLRIALNGRKLGEQVIIVRMSWKVGHPCCRFSMLEVPVPK